MKATEVIHNHAAIGGHGECHVYALSEPLDGATYLAVVVFDGPIGWQNKGVEVFACDETGWVPVMDTAYRSYLVETHAEVLARLGYTLETSGATDATTAGADDPDGV